jgi:DNA replication licensing factor MCM7
MSQKFWRQNQIAKKKKIEIVYMLQQIVDDVVPPPVGGDDLEGLRTDLDYEKERQKCERFLSTFKALRESRGSAGVQVEYLKYMVMLEKVKRRECREVCIELDDVFTFERDHAWTSAIEENALRYVNLFAEAVDNLCPAHTFTVDRDDVIDVLRLHRLQQMREFDEQNRTFDVNESAVSASGGGNGPSPLPATLLRRFDVRLIPRANTDARPIRRILASSIGHLVKARGIVTRVTDVRPKMAVATYTCHVCKCEIYQEVKNQVFMPLVRCPACEAQRQASAYQNSAEAAAAAASGGVGGGSGTPQLPSAAKAANTVHLQTRGSKFLKFQQICIQEISDEVPVGHIPRTLKIEATGELTRLVTPGDLCTISGIFLPKEYRGRRRLRSGGLLADTFLSAQHIHRHKKTYAEYEITDTMRARIEAHAREGTAEANGGAGAAAAGNALSVYDQLAQSIAPEIYGHEDLKKALLLMMVAAPTRQMTDGMRIRGEINVCLIGDPGLAKSQLLKYVSKVSPRGIYTSGKGSSGVGLTAAVLRDPVTREFVLEGGSLVLADMGVCCIDEFDKMTESDRTSIHEVMEQQTISIAKAGITTTLNARTSILAAANPQYGRYNTKRTPSENINLPAALLSRFDLCFLLLDVHDVDRDLKFARHVLHVHTHNEHPPLTFEPVTSEYLRAYIAHARSAEPYVPEALSDYIVSAYVNLREGGHERDAETTGAYTTARTLLAILRLSQALARLRLSAEVSQHDIDEAMRLMHMCKASLLAERSSNDMSDLRDPTSAIYSIIRDLAASSSSSSSQQQPRVQYDSILNRVLARGFTQQQLDDTLEQYEQLDIWQLSSDRQHLLFVS